MSGMLDLASPKSDGFRFALPILRWPPKTRPQSFFCSKYFSCGGVWPFLEGHRAPSSLT
jgi:hypothetical protein